MAVRPPHWVLVRETTLSPAAGSSFGEATSSQVPGIALPRCDNRYICALVIAFCTSCGVAAEAGRAPDVATSPIMQEPIHLPNRCRIMGVPRAAFWRREPSRTRDALPPPPGPGYSPPLANRLFNHIRPENAAGKLPNLGFAEKRPQRGFASKMRQTGRLRF